MKKFLLFVAAVLLASSTNAQEPKVYPNNAFRWLSPNGTYAVSTLYDVLTIHNLVTGEENEYVEEYFGGNGNAVSNNGIVVGSSALSESAAYWKNGQWYDIESVAGRALSYANGITADGSRIVGSVSPDNYAGDFEGLMLVPCYWDVEADGTVGELHLLPFPNKDLTGRTPQYVTAISISEDGKTIAGQIQDFVGFIVQPIIYQQNEDGEWSYKLIQNDLYHPEGIVLPEDPGEFEGAEPSPEDYMTEEELAAYLEAVDNYYNSQPIYPDFMNFMSEEERTAYLAALEEYFETWEGDYPNYEDYMTEEELAAYREAEDNYWNSQPIYPEYTDYMTEEEKAAYLADYEVYMAAYNEWDEKFMAYQLAYQELGENVPVLVFNNVLLSADAKSYVTSTEVGSYITGFYEYTPYIFNIEEETSKAYPSDVNLIVTSIADDGTLLAQKPASWEDLATEAYILPAGTDKFESLYDYFTTANAELADWIKENMTHEYEAYDMETWEEYVATALFTGIPFTNADMSIIATAVENIWEYESGIAAYGYILPVNYTTGLGSISNGKDAASVSGQKGGMLLFKGEVANATVYNMNGGKVYAVESPAATIATGLGAGVYVVKVVATNGTVTFAKVAL